MSTSRFEAAAVDAFLFEVILKQMAKYKTDRLGFEYEREKPVKKRGGGYGRVDLWCRIYDPRTGQTILAHNVEAKVNMGDLRSCAGTNFEEAWNFMIYPRSMTKYVQYGTPITFEKACNYLDKYGYSYVGILCLEDDGSITCERTASFRQRTGSIV